MGVALTEELGPVASRTIFENGDVRVWEMDLQPGEVCGLHHHTLDYVLFILSSASVGALRRGENPPGGKPRGFPLHARATYFVPAGGIESAHNVGATRFHEALFEIKRPAKRGAERLGFVGCEAVAGREPEPGTITILDNDRVRVSEITLAPGAESAMRRYSHDAVAYVAEGGDLTILERGADNAETARRSAMPQGCVAWYARGAGRKFQNPGTARFRQVLVELK
ncbi:MAG: cupin domain-containing protein [Candidatus Binataceae bacterium]